MSRTPSPGDPSPVEGGLLIAMVMASIAAFAATVSKDPGSTNGACTMGLGELPRGAMTAQTLAPCLQEPDLAVFLAYDWLFIGSFVLAGALAVRQCSAPPSPTGGRRRWAAALGHWGALLVVIYFVADSAENLLLITQSALSWGWLLAFCSIVKWLGAIATVLVIIAGCACLIGNRRVRRPPPSAPDDRPKPLGHLGQ